MRARQDAGRVRAGRGPRDAGAGDARAALLPHLRAPVLRVGDADHAFDNAAFVARLPGLQKLYVEGETFLPGGYIDITNVRSSDRLQLGSCCAATALFLGCVLARGEHTLRMPDGRASVCLGPLRGGVATRGLSGWDGSHLSGLA